MKQPEPEDILFCMRKFNDAMLLFKRAVEQLDNHVMTISRIEGKVDVILKNTYHQEKVK